MQIGKSTYVDIEIKDLDVKDFLHPEDLVDLQIIETAGTSLPIIYVAFLTSNQKIINHFIQRNTVTVKVGSSPQDCDSFLVSIYSCSPPNNGPLGERHIVEFAGFVMNQDFMINLESETYFGNSLLVVKALLNKHLQTVDNKKLLTSITKVKEDQVKWMQNNVTPCLFLAETLVHMDIRPSFPLFGFDRRCNFRLQDFDKVVKAGPVVNFVATTPKNTNEIQYINNFSVDDYKDMYNLYSGFNKVTEIWKTETGITEYAKSYNEPIIASTKESDMLESSSRVSMNTTQSSNVHKTYVEAFVHNTNKLVALSSMIGMVQLYGYYRNLHPTDIVTVSTAGGDMTFEGFYVIDTIRTKVDMQHGGLINTYVYVTRDNRNNIENYITNPKKGINVSKKFFASAMNSISQLRVAYAMAQNVIDGRYLKDILSFAIETKRNLLRSFVVAGVGIDFNSSALLLQSLTNVGNSLMNTLVSMIFPENIAYVLRDFIIRKPSLKGLLAKYISYFVPPELQALISMFSDSLFNTTNSLNSIAKANGIKVTASSSLSTTPLGDEEISLNVGGDDTVIDGSNTSEIDYTADSQGRIQDVVNQLENNSNWLGLDIPFPILDLSESQSLMSDSELKKYVVNQTITNLTNLGYLNGLTNDQKDLFESILMGDQPVENISEVNDLAQKINKNAGSIMYFRYWGTFNDLLDLTDFYIKKCYKDKYRTIPCTKLINATQDARLFFTCPESEEDLRFYINSKRIDVVENLDEILMDEEKAKEYRFKQVISYFTIDLGYTTAYGTPIPYRVYYTNLGYNSNSVLFEVKQGGMV